MATLLDGAGLYQMVEDKTCDTIYAQTAPEITTENEIPEPAATMFLVGDE